MATSLPRITARIDTETRELLSQAAAIIGMNSINSFVLSAAIEKARQIMDRERSLKLSQEDAMLLIKALDEESSPNSRLKQAAKRYSRKRADKA
ncbi:DUF1778 domain-containing protein [Endozoicomonas gorgoniicola]|uniref:DUF1778 domain-containing protein n=1 Tax=Endozoicomonas gorgoniicola TaxID=1234144 RepID=A0ABT3MUY9_9GAMM|nr:DUF1778 domain-containing protein [Endozoicomonas gorgoniicola]MCW7552898.1 DUF1778 domain-containing protein [Endozoicomonas gorgoniicola]